MSRLVFSRSWARYLAANSNLSQDKELIITYAIEVLVINLINVLLTLLLGLLLGVLPVTAACLASVFLFRHTAGGAHSKSPWRCAMITVIIFPTLAFIATFLSQFNRISGDVISALAVLTGFTAVLVLAPVDNPAAPIISPVRKKRLKILSLMAVILIATAIIILGQVGWEQALAFRNGLSLSLLWISFVLSKTGHRAINFIDGINLTQRR
ncbi:putative accessory gene regulator protein [Pelotomaculum schinkii]|uniref:Putative accessory gene regulator protein n=1 Tax=Pelotomaculum schinkii TaxID=78350 RepID=A0A4Y7RIH4_9FIRM|nr:MULTISPECIES: accessory gene regulator B family protein [Pelotomaculum]TEB08601.1 putative accessory gene regulator protein [Pelotomaculum schinkii]TEB16798.1 putative accessory gene regulator protein [Pelotomaculum sp. FP]